MNSLADSLSEAWRDQTRQAKGRGKSRPRKHAWASGWHPCRRKMALDMVHPEDIEHDEHALEAFRRGDVFEESARAWLKQAGRSADPPFEVIRDQESIELKDRQGRIVITGRMDGMIARDALCGCGHSWGDHADPEQNEGDGGCLECACGWFRPLRMIVEFKGGKSIRTLDTLDDFEASRWARGVPRQLAAYMLGLGIRYGVLVLERDRGAPFFLVLDIEDARVLDMAEDFLQRAELCRNVAEGEAELPGFTDQLGLCSTCDHRGKSCTPPQDYGDGLRVLQDPSLEVFAHDVVEGAEAAGRHSKARRALSQALRPPVSEVTEELPVLISLGGRYTVAGKLKPRKGSPGGMFSFDVEKTEAGGGS